MKTSKKQHIAVNCQLDSRVYNILLSLPASDHLKNLKYGIRYYGARCALYSYLFLSGLVCVPIFLFSPRSVKNSTFFANYFGRHTSHFYGISWEIRNEFRLSADRGAVVVANHQHELDIVGMFTLWPILGECAAVAKKEILWSPFGLAAWLAGVVFINRSHTKSAKARINQTSHVLHKKTKIFIFPEGTRNARIKETKTLLPFKKGAFLIAIQAQVPIIPIVYSPYYFLDEEEKILYPDGKVIMSVLPPVNTLGLNIKDANNLLERVRNLMQSEYDNLAEEVEELMKN